MMTLKGATIALLVALAAAGCARSAPQVEASPVYVSKLVGLHEGVCGVAAREAFDRLLDRLKDADLVHCQCVIAPLAWLEMDWGRQPGNAMVATLKTPTKLRFRPQVYMERLGGDHIVSVALYNRHRTGISNLYLGYRPKFWHGPQPWPIVYDTFQLNETPLNIAHRECGL